MEKEIKRQEKPPTRLVQVARIVLLIYIFKDENISAIEDGRQAYLNKNGHDACPTWVSCFLIRGTLLAPDGQNLCQMTDQ